MIFSTSKFTFLQIAEISGSVRITEIAFPYFTEASLILPNVVIA